MSINMESVLSIITGNYGRFRKYFITGILSLTVEYLVFYLVYRRARFHFLMANTAGIAVAFWTNFLLNRYWTFQSGTRFLRQLTLYGIVFIFNFSASNVLLQYVCNVLTIKPLVAKLFIMGVFALGNFWLYKRFVYR